MKEKKHRPIFAMGQAMENRQQVSLMDEVSRLKREMALKADPSLAKLWTNEDGSGAVPLQHALTVLGRVLRLQEEKKMPTDAELADLARKRLGIRMQ